MPDDLLDNVFGDVFAAPPDAILTCLIGGMHRAQERFNAKLKTVDEYGNPFDLDAPQITDNIRRDAGEGNHGS